MSEVFFQNPPLRAFLFYLLDRTERVFSAGIAQRIDDVARLRDEKTVQMPRFSVVQPEREKRQTPEPSKIFYTVGAYRIVARTHVFRLDVLYIDERALYKAVGAFYVAFGVGMPLFVELAFCLLYPYELIREIRIITHRRLAECAFGVAPS